MEYYNRSQNVLKLFKMFNLYSLLITGHELEVQQIGKTTDETSYKIGRFNTDTETDVTVQLFEQEIINLRKREASEGRQQRNSGSNRRLGFFCCRFVIIYMVILKMIYSVSIISITILKINLCRYFV